MHHISIMTFGDDSHCDVVTKMLTFLDVTHLCRVSRVNCFMKSASSAEQLWEFHWQEDTKDKLHVLRLDIPTKFALSHARQQSRRTWLSKVELTSLSWDFRFRKSAGNEWLDVDPYANGLEAAHVKFHADGSAQFSGIPGLDEKDTMWTWARSGAGKKGPQGSFLKLTVDGSPLPAYIVTRHSNWGFVLQNCWGVFISFLMPAAGADPSLEDDSLLDLSLSQQSEVLQYRKPSGLFRWLF